MQQDALRKGMIWWRKPKDPEYRWLFHGTTVETVPKIITNGFNRSYANLFCSYGRGTYFASMAYTSETFSKPDKFGNQYMFYCRVAVGEWCFGKPELHSPPIKENGITGIELYDTTVDCVPNPSAFVTYHDAQAYPAYLICFRKTK